MKLFEPTTDLIFLELKNIDNSKINNLVKINENINNLNRESKNKFIFLNDITFSYPGSKFFPVKNITMNINEGTIVGITGETGAGKSTLFHLMLGLLTPQQGNIFYKGKSIFSDLSSW